MYQICDTTHSILIHANSLDDWYFRMQLCNTMAISITPHSPPEHRIIKIVVKINNTRTSALQDSE